MSRCKFTKQSDTLTTVVYESKKLTKLWATIVRRDSSIYNITIRLGEDGPLLATVAVFRSNAFARRITRQVTKACMSCLGKHSRHRQNLRARKAAAKAEPLSPEAELAATVKRQKEIL